MEQVDLGDSSPSRLHLDPATMSASDFPPKKLVRQLDFTASCGPSTGVVLPQQPQLQPKQPHHQQRPKIQSPIPSHPMLLMSVSPQAPHTSMRILKPESPKSRVRPNAEVKEGTPKKLKQCNCKHSRCLKLYCECFASGVYCDGCNCANCHNNAEYEAARREAVEATLERNPNAFRPKIASSPHGGQDCREESREGLILAKHNKGCNCKKSGCLKKYCECFQAGILCSDNCKCLDCKNFEGSEERQALFHGDNTNSFAYIQQAANAAITGAIGSSGFGSPPISKKRKGNDLIFGQASKDSSVPRGTLCQQTNHIKASANFSSLPLVPTLRGGMNGSSAPSKLTYRSLLADIVQPNDIRELCSVLVVLSGESGQALRGKSDDVEKRKDNEGDASNVGDVLRCTGTPEAEGSSGGKEREMDVGSRDCSPEGGHVANGRAMSPGTLALMCDEQETMFMPAPGDFMRNGSGASLQPFCSKGNTEVYAEQERIVLTRFRDCLNRLITFGEIKEAKYSSLAKSDGLCHVECPRETSRSEAVNRAERVNGVSKPGFLSTKVYSGTPNLCPKVEGFAENGDVGR